MHFSSFCCPIWIIFLKYLVLWKVFTTFQGLLFFSLSAIIRKESDH